MTTPRRFESDLPALLVDLYLTGTPDYRDDLVQRIERTPQRSAWMFPERWLPVELVTARVPTTRMPWRQIGVLALVALLLAAILAAYIGSHRHVPPPYGLARNGVVAFVTPDGDIAIGDPRDGRSETLVSDPQQVRAPSFSLDGTRVAYQRLDKDGVNLMVVDVERRQTVQVATVPEATDTLQWSPDGSQVALISGGQVWIASTDGSGFKTMDLALTAEAEIEWRPPDGKELVVRGKRDGKVGLFLISLDGSDPRPISPMTNGEDDYLWHRPHVPALVAGWDPTCRDDMAERTARAGPSRRRAGR
jgi:hypothetical protein